MEYAINICSIILSCESIWLEEDTSSMEIRKQLWSVLYYLPVMDKPQKVKGMILFALRKLGQ